ncbi:hypothetical protein [Actibacterium ureilyticum]|uniref:hypothetical protein n=1 Tax=Actibacterium ureilyticum TaxID=1590614 RepID=UPI000BAAD561|nr:hypothetical protein [Actibacterium ureilyticum]
MRWLAIIGLGCATAAMAGSDQGADTLAPAPRPGTVAAQVAPRFAAFAGLWQGKWEGTLDVVFALQSADQTDCRAYVSWGQNALVADAGETVTPCREVGGELVIWMGEHNMIVLEPDQDDTLFGLFYTQDAERPFRVVLRPESRENDGG